MENRRNFLLIGILTWTVFLFCSNFFSAAKHAQVELLEYSDVRLPSYVWTSETPLTSETLIRKRLLVYTVERHSFDSIFIKLCQN